MKSEACLVSFILRTSLIRPFCILLVTSMSLPATLHAQAPENAIEEILVIGNLNSLPDTEISSITGFDKTLLETARSGSTISVEQMDRFSIDGIYDLVALAPSTFTQSFFGVAGSLDIRGTPGEVYFRGIRRLDNPGNYPTPIGASDRIDIVRGPASPIFGPARIGGYLNFVPKSARADSGQYMQRPEGKLSYSAGSWNKNVFTAEVGGPVSVSDQPAGYYLYAEVENSGSYYDNADTNQEILQLSFDTDLPGGIRLQFGGLYHDYDGNQVTGWNRLTQQLIDSGTYVTGSPLSLDTNNNGLISHQEFGTAFLGPFIFGPNILSNASKRAALPPDLALNPATVGTSRLEGRQVLLDPDDTLENQVTTLYFDVLNDKGGDWIFKNQLFYEAYDNLNENLHGFSQFHDTYVVEEKFIATHNSNPGAGELNVQLSPSVRHTDFEHGDDFINQYFDRRDLTKAASALDRRVLSTRTGIEYSTYYTGSYTDYGLAALLDYDMDSGLNLLLGARYDVIDLESSTPAQKLLFGSFTTGNFSVSPDGSNLLFIDGTVNQPVQASDKEEGMSWTASLLYESPLGLIPYVTLSEQATIVAGQGAEISTSNVANGYAFDISELKEVGLKGSLLDANLYFALSYYEQKRTDIEAQNAVTNIATETKGTEFELRWDVHERLTLTFGYSNTEVLNLDALENGGTFSFLGAEDLVGNPALQAAGNPVGTILISSKSQALRAGLPEQIYYATATYSLTDRMSVYASMIAADAVYSGASQKVRLPSYTLTNLGLEYRARSWGVNIAVKNAGDERYYRSNFPNLFGSQIVLPELPRHYAASVYLNF